MGINPIDSKVAEYKASHPYLAFTSDAVIISIMMQEGLISEQELNNLPNMLTSSELPSNEDSFLCEKPKEKLVSGETIKLDSLLKDKDGNLTPQNLTKENLEKLYSGTDCSIVEDNFGIKVLDKNKNLIYSISEFVDQININCIEKDSTCLTSYRKKDDGTYFIYSQTQNSLTKKSISERYFSPDGRETCIIHSTVDKDNNEIINYWADFSEKEKTEYVKDGKFVYAKEIKQAITDKPKSILDNIRNIFSKKEKENENEIISQAVINIPQLIGRLGLNKFLVQYEQINGSDFLDDAYFSDKEYSSNFAFNSVMNTFSNKYNKQFKEKEQKECEIFIKNRIKRVKEAINANDVEHVVSSTHTLGGNILFEEYPDFIKDLNKMDCDPNDKRVILETLISDFAESRNKESVKNVLNSDLTYLLQGKYREYIPTMKSNDLKLKEEILLDIIRDIQNSKYENLRDGEQYKENRPINGKIDLDFKQGTMGDCWLLTAIMGIRDKEGGQEYLNSLVKYDKENKTVTVNLKGVNKQYTFSEESIKNNKIMSEGDGDVVALEMAVNKFIKEKENGDIYSENFRIDSNGNWMKEAYTMLIGNGKKEIELPTQKGFGIVSAKKAKKQTPDYSKWENIINDFNNPEKIYSIAFRDNCRNEDNYNYKEDKFKWIDTETGKEEFIPFNHAISVKNMDDSFVYLREPSNSKKVYQIERERLKILLPEIESTEIDFS